MSFLKRVRPSNLIIVTALPFIIYLFISSADYQRSLRAILGVENGSSALVPGFLALAIAFSSGIAVLVLSRTKAHRPQLALAAAALNLFSAAAICSSGVVHPFVASVVANSVDPFTSSLVAKGVTPRQLTEAADLAVRGVEAVLYPALSRPDANRTWPIRCNAPQRRRQPSADDRQMVDRHHQRRWSNLHLLLRAYRLCGGRRHDHTRGPCRLCSRCVPRALLGRVAAAALLKADRTYLWDGHAGSCARMPPRS
jgi:hypothetical protein